MIQTPWERNGKPEYGGHSPLNLEADFLADIVATGRVALTQVGTSPQGRPISLVRLGAESPPPYAPHPMSGLWVASQHTRETSPREAALTFLRDAVEGTVPGLDNYLADHPMFIIPTPYPDTMGQEADPGVVDHNRDHLTLTHSGSRAISDVINTVRPQVVQDMHTGGITNVDVESAAFVGVDPDLRWLGGQAIAAIRDYLTSQGVETGPLPVNEDMPQTFRNVVGLRGMIGILSETFGGHVMSRRMSYDLAAMRGVIAWHAGAADQVAAVQRTAIMRASGAPSTSPSFLGTAHAAYVEPGPGGPAPIRTISPAPAAYRLSRAQFAAASAHLAAFGITSTPDTETGFGQLVPLAQAARPVIPLLLDPASTQAVVHATRVGHPVSGPLTPGHIQIEGTTCPIIDMSVDG